MSLSLDPSPVLHFTAGKDAQRTLRISNPNQSPVAFKVLTTAPKQYCVRPNRGTIGPGMSTDVEIRRQHTDKTPQKEKFLVKSMSISESQSATLVSDLQWDKPSNGKDIVYTQKLTASLSPDMIPENAGTEAVKSTNLPSSSARDPITKHRKGRSSHSNSPLSVNPSNVLEFHGPSDRPIKRTVTITNNSTQPMAFKVMQSYTVSPNMSRIGPNEKTDISVSLPNMLEVPPPSFKSKDRMKIRSVVVPPNESTRPLRDLFDVARDSIYEQVLKVAFLPATTPIPSKAGYPNYEQASDAPLLPVPAPIPSKIAHGSIPSVRLRPEKGLEFHGTTSEYISQGPTAQRAECTFTATNPDTIPIVIRVIVPDNIHAVPDIWRLEPEETVSIVVTLPKAPSHSTKKYRIAIECAAITLDRGNKTLEDVLARSSSLHGISGLHRQELKAIYVPPRSKTKSRSSGICSNNWFVTAKSYWIGGGNEAPG